jgi:hypothetical protein
MTLCLAALLTIPFQISGCHFKNNGKVSCQQKILIGKCYSNRIDVLTDIDVLVLSFCEIISCKGIYCRLSKFKFYEM